MCSGAGRQGEAKGPHPHEVIPDMANINAAAATNRVPTTPDLCTARPPRLPLPPVPLPDHCCSSWE
jgi:hypothetical protein